MSSDYGGLPSHAFTDLERAAGVPGIYGVSEEEGNQNLVIPTEEIDSNLNSDDLARVLLKGLCERSLDFSAELVGPQPYGARLDVESFETIDDKPDPRMYFRINYENEIANSLLAETIRKYKIPVYISDQHGFSWDAKRSLVKRTWIRLRQNFDKQDREQEELRDPFESMTVALMRRAELSREHGIKPVLLKANSCDQAVKRERVDFVQPNDLARQSWENYSLAYYDSKGQPRFIALDRIPPDVATICTRNATYRVDGDRLLCEQSDALLLYSAFIMATRYAPSSLAWYSNRHSGTVFEAAIERIDVDDSDKRMLALQEQGLLAKAKTFNLEVRARHSAMHRYFLTTGEHPLDSKHVTTPELYLYAAQTLREFGHEFVARDGMMEPKSNEPEPFDNMDLPDLPEP